MAVLEEFFQRALEGLPRQLQVCSNWRQVQHQLVQFMNTAQSFLEPKEEKWS